MKKFLSTLLTAIFFCLPLTVFAADSATEKLIQMEIETYGKEQPGALLERINHLEKEYTGKNMRGNLTVRIDSVYEILYGNSGAPSVLAKINAIEWNAYNEVSGNNVQDRLIRLEREIFGKTSKETLIKRIDALAKASFGNEEIPLTLQAGDLVDIKVSENVFVDGKLIFAKGLPGKGKVEKVRKAKGWTGRNGKVEIDFYTLNCIDGKSIDVFVGEESKNEMMGQQMIAGASLVGMNLNDDWNKVMVHGKNLEIPAGTQLYLQTEKTIELYGF